MARKLRIETAGGIYHVINRGNYRSDVFAAESTKHAFLRCLSETCAKTGWIVHAWCVMTNHYHLAIETPDPNLVEGMQWLQGTFCVRFNRFRGEQGHVFQGRYKALIVEPGPALATVCHYIHLNPVRAKIVSIDGLADWRWSSYRWIQRPRQRASWFNLRTALAHPASLADSPAGRRSYRDYLAWLAADTAEQKRQGFEQMCRGWAIGADGFKHTLLREIRFREAAVRSGMAEAREARELVWSIDLSELQRRCGDTRTRKKSADWKVAIAAVMKDRTTATNRWLSKQLNMGSMFAVSRLVSECRAGQRAAALYKYLTAIRKA